MATTTKTRPYVDFYDSLNIDDVLEGILEKYDSKEEFLDWLDAALHVQEVVMIDDPTTPLLTFCIGETKELPTVVVSLKAYSGCHSYCSDRHGDVDIDFLEVQVIDVVERPLLKDQVLYQIKVANATGVNPTTKEIAEVLKVKHHRVHNVFVELLREKKVQPMPLQCGEGWRLCNGQPDDPATIFQRATWEDKKTLLENASAVDAKAMINVFRSGHCSPSSNITESLNSLFGTDGKWPPNVGEAYGLLARDYGSRWSYSGD
jgi:hypothetical protein